MGLLGLPGMGLPTLHALIAAQEHASVPLAWISLFIEFIDSILRLAINGHLIIGTLRLFGYNVFRNTYKPLLAESLVEFWNRFYYYFKELLVEFFFFPTYVALSRRSQRFRIFAAVMAAAFFGNIYYHVLRDLEFLAAVGLERALGMIAPRVIYSFILALGISFSMMREQQRRGQPIEELGCIRARLRQVRRIGGVWIFYALLHAMVTGSIKIPLSYRVAFFNSLVGL